LGNIKAGGRRRNRQSLAEAFVANCSESAAVIAGNGLVGHFLFESVLNCSAAIWSICQPSPVPASAPDASEVPPRACNECGAQMKHLTDLPGAGLYPAKRIFRCYGCSFVVSERK
jgi:hypothetical protein